VCETSKIQNLSKIGLDLGNMLHLKFNPLLSMFCLATGFFAVTSLWDASEAPGIVNQGGHSALNLDLSDCLSYQLGNLVEGGENIPNVKNHLPVISQHIEQHFPSYQIVLARKLDNTDCGRFLLQVERGRLCFNLLFDPEGQLLYIEPAKNKLS